jgi:hypothetical protein
MASLALKVVVRFPGGRVEELIVDAERAVVGSGAHCEVRLQPEEAEAEHLTLAVDGDGVRAEVRARKSRVLMRGLPFEGGIVAPSDELEIGKLFVSVSPLGGMNTGLAAKDRKQRRESGSPLVYALGAVGFPLGFYLLFAAAPEAQDLPRSLEAPPLFAAEKPATCTDAEMGSAVVLGQKVLLEAESERERAPFSPEDGIAGVASFERAAACFARGGEPARAAAATSAAAALKTTLGEEFHVHQVRLERALTTRRYEDARTEVQLLLSFVGRQDTDYTRVLANLGRQIELKFSGKKDQ